MRAEVTEAIHPFVPWYSIAEKAQSFHILAPPCSIEQKNAQPKCKPDDSCLSHFTWWFQSLAVFLVLFSK